MPTIIEISKNKHNRYDDKNRKHYRCCKCGATGDGLSVDTRTSPTRTIYCIQCGPYQKVERI